MSRLRGYIVEKYNHMNGFYTTPRMIEEAKKADMELELVGVYDTMALPQTIAATHGILQQNITENVPSATHILLQNDGRILEPREFLINRYKWGRMKYDFNALCKKSYNSLASFERYVNKYEQVKRLSFRNIRTPDYICGSAVLPYELLAEKLGTPFIAKGLESSMGREIYLIHNANEYKELAKQGAEKEWLYETFISESFGRDLRIYSIRGQAIAAMIRRSASDFRANVALGATTTKHEITDEIRQVCREVYEQTGLDFVGIDLLFGKDSLYFCEINVMPGLEGIETTCDVNIAEMIMDMIWQDFH